MSSTITNNPSSSKIRSERAEKRQTIESDTVEKSSPYKSPSASRSKVDEYICRGPGKGIGITEPLYSDDQRKKSRSHE